MYIENELPVVIMKDLGEVVRRRCVTVASAVCAVLLLMLLLICFFTFPSEALSHAHHY